MYLQCIVKPRLKLVEVQLKYESAADPAMPPNVVLKGR